MRLVSMLVLSMLPGCAPGGTAVTAHRDDACTVAVRFTESWLRDLNNRPVIFSDHEDGAPPIPVAERWESRLEGWRMRPGEAGEVPPPSMLGEKAALSADSAVARCPALRAYLDRAHIPHGAQAVRAAQEKRDANGRFSADLLHLSFPSVSADGTAALVHTGFLQAPEIGGGELLLLRRRPDGSWHAVSRQSTWVT